MNDERVIESSGNVFADLGFADPEEELLKASLLRQFRDALAERGLSESEAAQLLELDRLDVSSIVIGRTGEYSIEDLVRYLDRLDYRVDVTVRRKPQCASGAAAT